MGNKKYLLVGTDYFTKWVETEPLANIRDVDVKRLDDAKGKWVEELPHVLWTYRTTSRRFTGETPFSMTYEAEAVIPLEIGFPTSRISSFNLKDNDEQLTKSLDLIKEKRENAMVQLAYY